MPAGVKAGVNAGVTAKAPTSYDRIYAAVRKVPAGRVTTYGAVARVAGLPGQARLVGYALANLRDGTAVPWHRVINAQGKLSLEAVGSTSGLTQRVRLQREGVRVDAAGRVSLAKFGWRVKEKNPLLP
ncbi:MAG: Methylated-DNA-[protein]-cysteine S-methyltransferase binding protein [Gemmatimonadetes bacterium]|nr:Methylated-DNA-[protein]-cysteine S-methyltransferase binding protein [Gemmatimonadota bacterium]